MSCPVLAVVVMGRLIPVLELSKGKLCGPTQGLSCWSGVVVWWDTHSSSCLCVFKGMG